MIYKCTRCHVVWARTAVTRRTLNPTPRLCPDCENKGK